MGKRFTVFDDIDDSLDAERTVTFAVDGAAYEIDLSQKNIDALNKVLGPFVEAARRVGRVLPVKGTVPKKPANPQLDAIRQWASQNGMRVSDKGRIPVDVVNAFEAAHAPTKDAKPAKTVQPAFSAV